MEYRDNWIALKVPEGFVFHSRPNYCTWDFTFDDRLVTVMAPTDEYVAMTEADIRGTKPSPGFDYEISGPHELTLDRGRAIYVESVRQLPGEFYHKQTQIVVHYADYPVIVVISAEAPFEIGQYLVLLDSIEVSMSEVEAARATFVPIRRSKRRKDGNQTGSGGSSAELPPELAYLQEGFDELSAASAEELEYDHESFAPFLVDGLRERLRGLSLGDALERVEADYKELEAWLQRGGEDSPPGQYLLVWLSTMQKMMMVTGSFFP